MVRFMSDLAEKIRQSRRVEITVKKMKFFGRRATTAEFYKLSRDSAEDVDVAKMLIDGWQGVREKDMFEGGDDKEIPFNQETFNEAIGDLPGILKPIVEKLIQATSDHIKKMVANEKNSNAGSKQAS